MANSELIPIDAVVNLDDVVSVRVAEVEVRLDGLVTDQKAKVQKSRELVAKIEAEVNTAAKTDAQADFKKRFPQLDVAFKKAGLDLSVSFEPSSSVTVAGVTDNDEDDEEGPKGTVGYVITLSGKKADNYRYGGHSLHVNCPLGKVKNVLEDLRNARAVFKSDNDKLIKLLEAKGKVPQVERAARATVAQSRLEKTAEGREILQRLRADDVNRLLQLPAGTISTK